jgi:hypothetical protein
VIVKLDIGMSVDPAANQTGKSRGYSVFRRDAGYRSITLTREQADTIYERLCGLAEEQIQAYTPMEGKVARG